MTSIEFVVAIVVAILGSNGLWAFFSHMSDKKSDKKDDLKELKEDVENLRDDINEITDLLKKTNELAISTARDRLNYLSHKYMEQGFIPKEYATPYKLIGAAYKANDGNTIVAEEFELCMKNLPIK